MDQRGSDEGAWRRGGGRGGERFRVKRWGGRGVRAGRREVARGRFAPRRAPRRARRMDKSPAPKPQNPETPKRRRRGPRARNATPRRGLEGEDRRGAPRRARRAARTLGAARANGASASAVGAVRRSNDGGGGGRRTLGTQAERGGAHAVHRRERGERLALRGARRGGVAADAHRGHRRGEGGHAEHRV